SHSEIHRAIKKCSRSPTKATTSPGDQSSGKRPDHLFALLDEANADPSSLSLSDGFHLFDDNSLLRNSRLNQMLADTCESRLAAGRGIFLFHYKVKEYAFFQL